MSLASIVAQALAEAADKRGLARIHVGTVRAVSSTDPTATVEFDDTTDTAVMRYLAGVQPREGDRVQTVDLGGTQWIIGRLATVPLEGPWEPGDLKASAAAVVAPPWIRCEGQTLNTVDYPRLAEALGFGGSTFTVPDYRGRVIIGPGDGFALGANGGTQEATMPQHSHGAAGDHVHTLRHVAVASGSGTNAYSPTAAGTQSSTGVGGSLDHSHADAGGTGDNYPPFTVANVLIHP